LSLLAPPACYTLSLHDALPILGGSYSCQQDLCGWSRDKGSGRSKHRPEGGARESRGGAVYEACEDPRLRRTLPEGADHGRPSRRDRKSTRLNSSHQITSYAVFC